jgi:hypothetical protein
VRQELCHALDQRIQLDVLELQGLAAGEDQQQPRQINALERGLERVA